MRCMLSAVDLEQAALQQLGIAGQQAELAAGAEREEVAPGRHVGSKNQRLQRAGKQCSGQSGRPAGNRAGMAVTAAVRPPARN